MKNYIWHGFVVVLVCVLGSTCTTAWAQVEKEIQVLKIELENHPEDGDLLCRLGNLYLQEGKADSAENAFEQALRKDERLYHAHVGLGRVYLERQLKPKKSLSYFRNAIKVDSTQAMAFGFLAGAYLEMGKDDDAEAFAQKALKMDANYAPSYLVLARLAQKQENTSGAMLFYQKYTDLNPQDPRPVLAFAQDFLEKKEYDRVAEIASHMKNAVVLPLLAQVRMHGQDHEGAYALFDTYIKSLSDKEKDLYDDISSVGLAQEVAAYRTVLPENREAFLKAFWLKKDPFKTSGGIMRRVEHYRRVWYARLYFGKKQWPWDKRGDVYVRYGDPDYKSNWREMNAKVPLKVQRVQEQIAFQLYGRQGLDVTYVGPVFPIRTERDDVDLNRPLNDPGFAGIGLLGWKPVTVGNAWTAVPWEVWIYTEIDNGLEVVFTDEYHSGIYGFAPVPNLSLDEVRSVADRDRGSPLTFAQRLTTFSPANRVASVASKEPEHFDISDLEPFKFYYDPLAFRGPNGQTELQIDFGLPIDDVILPDDRGKFSIAVERRFALLDARNTEVARSRKDMGLSISDEIRGKGLMARDQVRLNMPPGTYELAVQMWRVETNLLGVYHQTLDVHDFTGDALMLSDLQVAQHIAEKTDKSNPTFVRGKWSLVTSPSRTFREGDPVFVYFEAYNLSRDQFGATHYEVSFTFGEEKTLTQARIRQKDGESVAVQYSQTGTETWVADYVELNIGKVKPGRYALHMHMRDLNSEQETDREGIFRVIKK